MLAGSLIVVSMDYWFTRSGALSLGLSAVAVIALEIGKRQSSLLGRWHGRRAQLVPLAAVGVLSLVLATYTHTLASATNRHIFAANRDGVCVGRGWQYLDSLPAGARVARFSHVYWGELYPLLGRRLQHRIIFVNENGTAKAPLHVLVKDEPQFECTIVYTVPKSKAENVTGRRLVENLRAAGVDYVFVSRYALHGSMDHWPIQYDLLTHCNDATRVYEDGDNAVFRIEEALREREQLELVK